jgi:guanine deaminase
MLINSEKLIFINRAIDLSLTDIDQPFGRPFGAVVVYNGQIISEAFNTAARVNDPTGHAEVNAVRLACARLATYILPQGTILFSSAEPCLLCFSAAFWAGIETIYFALSASETSFYGFSDERLSKIVGTETIRGIQLFDADMERAHFAFSEFLRTHPEWSSQPNESEIRQQL